MTKAIKALILAIFVFQMWFSQAYFYPPDFAEWRARTALANYLGVKLSDINHVDLQPRPHYTATPGPLALKEIYDTGYTRRRATWDFSFVIHGPADSDFGRSILSEPDLADPDLADLDLTDFVFVNKVMMVPSGRTVVYRSRSVGIPILSTEIFAYEESRP